MHPAVLEFARIIGGERRFLLPLYTCHCREDTKTHQHLKTVTDPEDQFTIAQELAQGTLQAIAQLRSQDNARRDVIAKRKSTGNGQDMKTLELLWLGNEVSHVHTRGFPANRGKVEGMGSLILAVDTVSSQYQDLGTFHKCSYTMTNTSRRLVKIKHIFSSVSHVPLDVTKSLEPLTEKPMRTSALVRPRRHKRLDNI